MYLCSVKVFVFLLDVELGEMKQVSLDHQDQYRFYIVVLLTVTTPKQVTF